MKLKKLKIENYRSIKKFETELSPKINMFVGSSDSGKSNIVRVIRDLAFNATGDGFITFGKDKCSVMINDVMWERGEGINRYRNKQGVFNNVGRNSPQEIRDDLRIDEVNWDENLTKKIQFIEQHEPIFFLSYTESLNAKILGKVSGIQRVYIATKKINDDKREINKRKVFIEEEIEKRKSELKQYENVDEIEGLLEELKNRIEKFNNIESYLIDIKSKYQNYVKIKKQIFSAKESLSNLIIDEDVLRKLESMNLEYIKISELYNAYLDCKKQIEKMDESVGILKVDGERVKKELETYLNQSNICPITRFKFYDDCQANILKAS